MTSLFFIVGCPRSGTTLVQRLLSTHPESTVLPETFFVRRLMPNHRTLMNPLLQSEHNVLVQAVLQSEAWSVQDLSEEALHREVQRQPQTGAGVLRAWMYTAARAHGVPVVGEKTPDHALQVAALHHALPEARFVHVIRDPRAVVNSWRTVPWSSGYVWRDADLWRERVQAVRQAPESAPVHTVRFEQLVQAPATTMQRVAAFLGLSPGHMWTRDDVDAEQVAVDAEAEPWKQNALAPIDPAVATRWRRALPEADQAMVEHMAAREMQRWGYMPEASAAARRAAAWRKPRQHIRWKADLLLQEWNGGS
ncbi:sulfotransferase family protein [Longimonas halophila]|uniref:sulfotransferase family protein n=1 Tax=Longimonas halophila TaxID=1469170 RepID=UPI0011450DB1|nr:sulfotransferase [Longimonas halophila]